MNKLLLKIQLVIFATISFAVNAEVELDLYSMSLGQLSDIQIATKNKQTVYSSPSSVSIVSREEIQQLGIHTLQELLNIIPGYQSTRDIEQGTANRIVARGRSTALSESVLVLVDGHRLNDLYTGGISILNRMLTLGYIEKIEIIRGPGSALYGSNAFLGAINIVTTTGKNEVTSHIDSEGESSVQMLFHHEDYQLDVFLSMIDSGGHDYDFVDLYGQQIPTKDPYTGYDFYAKYRLDSWQFFARYMQRELDDFLPLGTIGNDINKEKTYQWSVVAEHDITVDKITFNSTVHYSEDSWDSLAVLIPENVELAPDFSLQSNFIGGPYLTSSTFKINSSASYQMNENENWQFGLSYESSRITDLHTSTTHNLATLEPYGELIELIGDETFNVKESRDIGSAYIQHQRNIDDKFEMTLGLRFDNYDDFGSSLNPRAAFIWHSSDKSSLKFMYGSAFRAPNFLELYDKNNYVDFGNNSLNAEHVDTIELAWVLTQSNIHTEVTLFENKFDNLIVLGAPVVDEENPFYSPQFTNLDGLSSKGIETEIKARFSSNFSMSANYTWFTRDSDISTSRQAATVIIKYDSEFANVAMTNKFRGKSPFVEEQNSYWLTNINISRQLNENLSVDFFAKNLFDEQYRTTSIIYPKGVPNRGRSIGLSINYQM